jgi:hypothetical protein
VIAAVGATSTELRVITDTSETGGSPFLVSGFTAAPGAAPTMVRAGGPWMLSPESDSGWMPIDVATGSVL